MKFMRITGPKDTYMTLPAEKQSDLATASFAFFEKYKKARKCKDWYWLMDGRMVSTWDFDSIEEMASIIMEEPMRVYITVESLPFMDWEEAVKMRGQRSMVAKNAAKK